LARLLPARPAGVVLALAGALAIASPTTATAAPVTFSPAVKLTGAAGGTEPRLVVGPGERLWVLTNDAETGRAVVFGSEEGMSWERTSGELPGRLRPSIDNELTVTPMGRLVAVESDGAGAGLATSFSDDRGVNWWSSSATGLLDQYRPWLAVGPLDPLTHESRVYLLSHNPLAGPAHHNMWVSTSADGGQSFGPPVALTLPGSEAYTDLRCGGASGPSGVAVDQATGRIYASFGTRNAALGGCGTAGVRSPDLGAPAETRIWVATSPDGSPGSWELHLAVDASPSVVSAATEPVAVDPAGHVYVAYAETANPYPDFSGATVKYVWSPPGAQRWSHPVTVAPAGAVGRYDPSIVAAGRGKLALAYFTGKERSRGDPAWYVDAALVRNGESSAPQVRRVRVADVPAYTATPSEMAGACRSGPARAADTLLCPKASDNWGLGLDIRCRLVVVFPTVASDTPGSVPGTFVATQSGGPTVCNQDEGALAPGAVRLFVSELRRNANGLAVRVRALGGTARAVRVRLASRAARGFVDAARGSADVAGRRGTRVALQRTSRAPLTAGRYRLFVTARAADGAQLRATRWVHVR
jgi:hypothetical protein